MTMPKQKHKKQISPEKRSLGSIGFLERRPILGYIIITLTLMMFVFFAEQGTEFYRASILSIPKFDGTTLPVQYAPDWKKTGGKNTKAYSEYRSSDLIALPKYDPKKLEKDCSQENTSYQNACITYSTVYMGSYQMDHKEFSGSHLAVDIRVPIGTPVYSVANGVVESAVSRITGFGKYVVIKHPNAPLVEGGKDTLFSGYAHLSEVVVKEGNTVKKGDLIGYSGDTGLSTTPHLHFQIDRSSAPYHPWWPFSSAQASSENLNFFEAIDAGLGQKEALENTTNPLIWVQEFLSSPTTISSSDEEEIAPEDSLGRIVVKADKSSALPGEIVTFLVTVLDIQKQILKEYTGTSFKVSANKGSAKIPTNISFQNGKAEIPVVVQTAGNIEFTFQDGNTTAKTSVNVEEGKDTEELRAPETDVVIPETIENPDAVARVEWKGGEDMIRVGKRTTMDISLFNAKGEVLNNPEFSDSLEIQVKGGGEVNPKMLLPRYFKNGVATVEYLAGRDVGTAEIFLTRFPNSSIKISVIEAPEQPVGFSVETDERFRMGKAETISLTTIDKNGNRTPNGFLGEAELTLLSGKAKITPQTLTEDDFINGRAEVEVLPLSKENIVVKIQSGVLVGVSEKLQEGEEKTETGASTLSIFSDIPTNYKNVTAISFLKDAGILSGNADGTFRPNDGINRAEFAKVMLLAIHKEPKSARGGVFSDVPKNEWFAPYVETAAELGIIEGYPDGSFRPANNINRAELFTMLARSFNGSHLSEKTYFSDVPQNIWYETAAQFAKEKKLLDFGNQFEPGKIMTRAEVAEAVFRVLNL